MTVGYIKPINYDKYSQLILVDNTIRGDDGLTDYEFCSLLPLQIWKKNDRTTSYANLNCTVSHLIMFKENSILYRENRLKRLVIDHRDRNTLNNTRSNLQWVTTSHNMRNRIRSNTSSQYRGLYWHKRDKRWRAVINIDSKKNLGSFLHEEDAARAYDKAIFEIYGCKHPELFNFPKTYNCQPFANELNYKTLLARDNKNKLDIEFIVSAKDYDFLSLFTYDINHMRNYYTVQLSLKNSCHKIIMQRHNTYMHDLVVDHINHNGLDNTIPNLRMVTQSQNIRNSRCNNDSSEKYISITKYNTYRVLIPEYTYDTLEEAITSRDKICKQLNKKVKSKNHYIYNHKKKYQIQITVGTYKTLPEAVVARDWALPIILPQEKQYLCLN